MSEEKKYMDLQIKKEASKAIINFNVDKKQLETYKDAVVEEKRKHFVIPGFRKGQAPKELVVKQLGEQNIEELAAKDLVADAFAQIIVDNELKVIARPDIEIEKVDDKYKATAKVILYPEFDLPDYKQIAKEHNSKEKEGPEVTEDEVNQVIRKVREEKARILTLEKMQKDKSIQMPDFSQIPDDKLPPLDERDYQDLASTKDEQEFREKTKENIKLEKERAMQEQRRAELFDALVENTEINISDELIEAEYKMAMQAFEQELQMSGLSFDDYLTQTNTTKEEFEKIQKENAKKRVVLQFVLQKIAEKENLIPKREEIEKELDAMSKIYGEQFDTAQAEPFVFQNILTQKVVDFLEAVK